MGSLKYRVQACKLKVTTSIYKSTQEFGNVLPSVVLWEALYTAAGLLEVCLTTLMPGIFVSYYHGVLSASLFLFAFE